MDYSKTLSLPDTSLPVKADAAKTELEIMNIWKDLDIYKRRQRLNQGKPKFLVYDPPRPAHNYVCIDDAFNMILKDIIVKYKLMRGFDVPHFPSWDCYIPAIEREALRLLEGKSGKARQSEVQRQCQSLCSKYIDLQKEQFQRLGIFAYWDKAVLTSSSNYKSRMIEAFGDLYEAGFLYKGARPTHWCISCQTDLVGTEVEYRDRKLLSLYVKFPVIHGLEELGEDVYMVVWTNTPWTLSANTAVAVHPDYDYVAAETVDNEVLIMAASAIEDATGSQYKTIRKMKGLALEKIVYAHPFLDRDSNVLLDKRVSLVRGTGCVHATPGYNQGGYIGPLSQQSDSEIISTVDQNGRLTENAGQFCGLNVFESSDLIALELEKRGCLLAAEPMEQSYPHCLHCKKPIVVRVADKWIFNLGTSNLRQRILKIVEEVNWLPGWSRDRVSDTIANRSDWDVSRRRMWGIPAPVFYCSKCNAQVDTCESINASRDMISRKGIHRWLTAKPSDILSNDVVCNRCGGRDFHRKTDILDAGFVSAMSYRAAFSNNKEPLQSADIYLGNNGQNEKWIQLSLLPSIAMEGSPPFKSVLIHGGIVDEHGKRIPGPEGGGPSIQDLLDEFGADILRLWVTSMDCKKHLKMSHSYLKQVSKVCRRVRNACRFLLSNLSGHDPESDRVDYAYLQEVDRWALHRLTRFIDDATQALENCRFHLFYHLLHNFCSVDTLSLYLSIVKRRLYTFPRWSSGRRAVQTVLYEVLIALTRLMAPILSFTAEEIWRYIPGTDGNCPSVYLSHWPDVNESFLDDELESRWNYLLKIRSEIYKLLEKVRQEEKISGSSQACVILYASSPDVYKLLDRYIDDLEVIFIVSKVRLMPPDSPVPDGVWRSDNVKGLAVEIRRTTGEKCERCWIYSDTVGTNKQYPSLCYRCIAILEGGTYYI